MTRRLTSLLILTLLFVALVAATSEASRKGDVSFDKIKAYGFPSQSAEDMWQASSRGGVKASLGSMTADGGSPGAIVGRSFDDRQNWYESGRTADWRNSPVVHFVFANKLLGGPDLNSAAVWMTYRMFNPTVSEQGVWLTEVWMQTDPFNYTNIMPQLAVDTTGHALPAGYTITANIADDPNNCEIHWDLAGVGNWGTFLGDTLPQSLSPDAGATIGYPKIEFQYFDNKLITHIAAIEFLTDRTCAYWRREGDVGTFGGWTRTHITDAMNWSGEMCIASSTVDGKVAIGYLTNHGEAWDNVAYVESTDGGLNWGSETEIINLDQSEGAINWLPWCNIEALYDTDGYLHLVYNTMQVVDGARGGIDPARLFHWTNRVSGTNGGGKLSLVAIADFHGLAPMCGRAGTNVVNLAKGTISQCDTNLIIIWQQFGDPDKGDSLDCPADMPWGANYNADIFMSVSLTLDGTLWDAARDITNSHNPDCDSTADNNCDHDNYASPSRYAMNVAAMGDTYWGAVPEAYQVRDVIDPTYPDDGWYVDVQYINDLFPGVAYWRTGEGENVWTYNPIKWFRLPCTDPIIKPQINVSWPDFLAPTDWVKIGEPEVIADVLVENIGNEELEVDSVTVTVTTGSDAWVSIANAISTIEAAGSDVFDVTLNPGGIVTTQEVLEADIYVYSNDPDREEIRAFHISTIIADTVVQVVWDTIMTDAGFALTIANQGQSGHSGWGNVNMDFVYIDSTGPECTLTDTNYATEHVYFYDACPVFMLDNTGDFGTYAWNPFWIPARASAHDFRPVPGSATPEAIDQGDYMTYQSDPFVTPDSNYTMQYKWWIVDGEPFVIKEMKVTTDELFSLSVYLGEWIDWDIPTLTDGNQGGFVADSGPWNIDYVYQQGKPDIAADPQPCLDPERRFGVSGLLGYWYDSEHEIDPMANNSALYGGHILLDDDLFEEGTDQFILDSAWAWLGRDALTANNTEDADQQAFLSYGSFILTTADTLHIFTVHASIYDGDEDSVQAVIDRAGTWYNDYILTDPGCCGTLVDSSGKYPLGYSGNANCSLDGKRTLSDISRLIDRLYISKAALCCYAAGNANGSLDWNEDLQINECKITLSDVSRLIDALYISKALAAECQSDCEREDEGG